ncbi:MAG: hypothetical protein H6809_05600, partial [Phycisphaeraceae bacterium]|nr:hypothetical protein [Phycisphaeraceae bacterium]
GRIVAAGAVGESSLDAGVLTLARVLEGSRGQAAAARQAIAEAERDITSGAFEQERLDGAKLACERAIAAAERKIGYDAISMALGQVDSTRAVEAMVRGAAQTSPAGVAELRPMEMTDSINGIDVDPKYDPAAAGRAFAAITTALGLVGASEDPNAAGAVLERGQIDGMVADAQSVMRDYASDYVRYWGEQVPEALYRVRPNGTWAEFQTAASRLNRRTIGGNIESNGEVLRDALAVVGPQLLESERDRDLLALQRRIAAHEADVGGVNETASTAQRLLSSFANLPSLVPAARQRVLAMDVGAFENDFLNYFYLTNDDGEVIRYWRYMTLAAFEKLAAESNDQAGAALLSLQQNRRVFPLCKDSPQNLSPADLAAVAQEVALVGSAAARNQQSGAAGTIGVPRSIDDQEMEDQIAILRGAGVPQGQREWFEGVQRMLSALRPSGENPAPLTFSLSTPAPDERLRLADPSVDAAATYLYLHLVEGATPRRFENETAAQRGGVSTRRQWTNAGLRVPNNESLELWFYVEEEGARDRREQRVPLGQSGADPWAALRAISRDGARPIDPNEAAGTCKAWWVPIEWSDADGRQQYWVRIEFNRDIPLPPRWPTMGNWARSN